MKVTNERLNLWRYKTKMTYIAFTIVAVWAIFVAKELHDFAVLSNGRIATRPKLFQTIFSTAFFVVWGIPSAIFLAIFGGVFWW